MTPSFLYFEQPTTQAECLREVQNRITEQTHLALELRQGIHGGLAHAHELFRNHSSQVLDVVG